MRSLLISMFRAGVALAWEVRFELLGKATKAATKRYIDPHVVRTSGSRFASVRALRTLKPVWKRAIHAPSEGLIPLPKISSPVTAKYVVQLHEAKRAGPHYDLRLMIKGRGISFAIPKHRMPEVGENLLAVLQPDHIEEYFDFEGTIPDGQKGAGSVEIIAAGEVDILNCDEGKLVFEIPDGPVSGRYVVIMTGGGPRGDHAIVRSFPPVIEQAVKPQVRLFGKRSEDYFSKAVQAQEDGHVLEEKVDGACAGWWVDKEGRAELSGPRLSKRDGKPIRYTHKLPKLRADLAKANLKNQSGQGELWHRRGPNFVAAVLNSSPTRARHLQHKYGPVRLKLYNLDEEVPYNERYQRLKQISRAAGPTVEVVKQFAPKNAALAVTFAEWCRIDPKTPRDGFVAKDPDGLDTVWRKGKPTDSVDTPIIGFKEGSGRCTGSLGSLLVQSSGGKTVSIGTGFTDFQRDWIWAHRDELVGDIVSVKFHERANTDLSNTGGRFDGFHAGKSEAGLKMYAEALADGTDKTPEEIKYALISAAGWRR